MAASLLELRKFVIPEIIIGIDARLLINRYIAHFNAQKPMIVTDKQVQHFRWFQETIDLIHPAVEQLIFFDEITPNPKDFEAMLGADLFLSQNCDLLIAIGGGSAIDCAKCISIVASNGGNILDYEGVDEVQMPGPPLICIPTTAGSSADVSQFAIIKDTSTNIKRAIISKKVVPDLALIDPVPLMTMDPYLTGCTAMDALTHAIEAYVSNTHSALTDIHALEAIKLINQEIENAVNPQRTIETMFQLMLGSLHAGLAFSNASLGAVHAMSHALGGLLDLPHGECNSILLEHIIRFNFAAVPDRYQMIAKQLGLLVNNADASILLETIINHIILIREKLHIPATLTVARLDEMTIDYLIENALYDPCMVTNPKVLTKDEVRIIYGRILQSQK
ncbi:iron-containing alcohol dehydrogenase [Acetobacterium woodii]|uniref:Alcohol dehydrogenase, iron-type n=1 Tax=Acetobacterium woodii (strain ATCC 29683 / DSM 1030 / JCM 2381 / KCTC 1655 / WB1) TaxID=931626 RepID=H6LJ03_ACEWD|nr:iron-containing alcohol dehydrogenase [Acetobacterium woodii]AFA47366.1 alcohol dehydrogenase, iron-type [Acetobacterium woodii DSM 1030]